MFIVLAVTFQLCNTLSITSGNNSSIWQQISASSQKQGVPTNTRQGGSPEEGAVQPPSRGQQGTRTAVTRQKRLYRGASPATDPKNECQKVQLRTQSHRDLYGLISVTCCCAVGEQCWAAPGDRPVPLSPSSPRANASDQDQSALADAALPRFVCRRAGCLLPDNKLSTRLLLWDVPPSLPPQQAGDEAEEITYSSLPPPPMSHPAHTEADPAHGPNHSEGQD